MYYSHHYTIKQVKRRRNKIGLRLETVGYGLKNFVQIDTK